MRRAADATFDGGLGAYLNLLYGAEHDAYVELRWKPRDGVGMGREFVPVHDPRLAPLIRQRGKETDVYVGVAPRARQDGTRAGIDRVHALWADLDGADALTVLARFEPQPMMIVASGSPGSAHAYWVIHPPGTPDEVERANRKLGRALGADLRATDAARILRPPGTLNWKSAPPGQVELLELRLGTYSVDEVVGDLPPAPARPESAVRTALPSPQRSPLDDIPPPIYVEALTGQEIGRDGKVACPFHPDRTPSLHVYAEPSRGWTCFGCGRGGTIIDFGAALYGIEPRGAGFHRIRERLEADVVSALRSAA